MSDRKFVRFVKLASYRNQTFGKCSIQAATAVWNQRKNNMAIQDDCLRTTTYVWISAVRNDKNNRGETHK